MPVSFPLDKIPALPAQAVALMVDQINVFVNKIQLEIEATISEAAKLPDDCGCDYQPILLNAESRDERQTQRGIHQRCYWGESHSY